VKSCLHPRAVPADAYRVVRLSAGLALAEATLEPLRSFRQDFDLPPTGDSKAASPAATQGSNALDTSSTLSTWQ
jgi:hypothetical protein